MDAVRATIKFAIAMGYGITSVNSFASHKSTCLGKPYSTMKLSKRMNTRSGGKPISFSHYKPLVEVDLAVLL